MTNNLHSPLPAGPTYVEGCWHTTTQCDPMICGFGCKSHYIIDPEGTKVFAGQLCTDPTVEACVVIGLMANEWDQIDIKVQEATFSGSFTTFKAWFYPKNKEDLWKQAKEQQDLINDMPLGA